MTYRIEVKHDMLDKTWIPLTVRFHEDATLEDIRAAAIYHGVQYAIDHQYNPDMIAVRVVDAERVQWWHRESSSQANWPK